MKRNSEEMFLEIYEAHADAIFRHCYFRVSNRERAKELSQETFMKAWEYVAGGKEIEHMKALLYRIANNLVIDEWRKKKSVSLDEMQEGGFDIGDESAKKIHGQLDAKDILPHLEKLEPTYRDAVVMRYIDDMSPKEIAKATGESENVISVRIHRGINKLRGIVARGPSPNLGEAEEG